MWKFFSFLTKSSAGGSSKCAVGRRSEIELNIWQITFIKSAWELEKEKTIQELLKFEDQSTGEWKEKCAFFYGYLNEEINEWSVGLDKSLISRAILQCIQDVSDRKVHLLQSSSSDPSEHSALQCFMISLIVAPEFEMRIEIAWDGIGDWLLNNSASRI